MKIGDHVRTKVRTIGGWKGTGTVLRMGDGLVVIRKDPEEVVFCIEEVERLENQRTTQSK